MLRKGMALIAFVLACAGYASAGSAEESVWRHNGSTVRLVTDGDEVSAYYLEPRPALRKSGVASGQLLFQGKRSGERLEGFTYDFRRGCPPLGFFVGSTDLGQDRIVLAGSGPVRGARGCAEVARKTVTLTFERQIETQQAAAAEADVQAPARPAHAPLNGQEVHRLLKWILSAAANEREALYDSCAFVWNKMNWSRRGGGKVLVAGVRQNADGVYLASCFARTARAVERASGAIDALANKAVADCKGHFDGCYLFAAGNRLAEWAVAEEQRVADGSRIAAAAPAGEPADSSASANVDAAPDDAGPSGTAESGSGDAGSGSGITLDQAIGLTTGLLNGVNALRGVSGGGSAPVSTARGGGGGSGSASCAQAKAHAQTCYQRWKSMGGGMSGQARSFYDCYQVYNNAC